MKTVLMILSFVILMNAQNFENKQVLRSNAQSLSKLSNIEYPGDSNFDVTYYKLDVKITDVPEYLAGVATIKAKPNSDNLNIALFDLVDSLQVNSILMNGASVGFAHGDNILLVNLDRSYNSDEYFSIAINYEGHPDPSYWGSFVFTKVGAAGMSDSISSIWSLSEPYGSSAWWPCKDTPADKADSSDVWITVKENLVAVSNGTLEAELNNGDGFKTFRWKNHYPISQYLISVAIAPYQRVNIPWQYEPGKFMDVIHYIYPEGMTRATTAQLEETNDMLTVYSDLFGLYPFVNEKYGHAEWRWGGAMEHQTCTTTAAFYQDIVAHELAHQWFGDKITCKDWENIWLNEGFATYCEILYEEAKNGFESAYAKFLTDYSSAQNAEGSIYVRDITSVGEIFNGNRSYAKGGVVLHMLRGVVGDDNFFNIMKTYANDEQVAYGAAETADFQRVAEAVSGMDLNYFFDEWIYGENYPKYFASWSQTHVNGSLYDINLNITQTTNTIPDFFTMPVPIYISSAFGDTTVTVWNDQDNQNFTIRVLGKPTTLEIDPQNWILKDVEMVLSNENEQDLITEYSLMQNYPNPFNPVTTIVYSVPDNPDQLTDNVNPKNELTELVIYDALGKKVKTLLNRYISPGRHEITFNANDLSSGVYYYTLKSGNFKATKKMVLLK